MNGRSIVLLVAVLSQASPASAQERRVNTNYLRADARLQARVQVDPDRPSLTHILGRLREATGLDLTLDQNLQDHRPRFGRVQPARRGYLAWQLLELVAEKGLEGGEWKPTPRGFYLVGKPLARPHTDAEEPPSLTQPLLLSLTAFAGVVASLAVLRWLTGAGRKSGRKDDGAASAPPSPPVPD